MEEEEEEEEEDIIDYLPLKRAKND